MAHPLTAGASRRTRRQRRAVITFVLVIAFLAASFWYAYRYITTDESAAGTVTSAAACPTNPYGSGASVRFVSINVYNATDRAGLAADVAKTLKARGFTIGQVANDPLGKKVAGTGELRYGPAGKTHALTASKLVTDLVKVTDKRTDTSVDLVLGKGFVELEPERTCRS